MFSSALSLGSLAIVDGISRKKEGYSTLFQWSNLRCCPAAIQRSGKGWPQISSEEKRHPEAAEHGFQHCWLHWRRHPTGQGKPPAGNLSVIPAGVLPPKKIPLSGETQGFQGIDKKLSVPFLFVSLTPFSHTYVAYLWHRKSL